MKSDDFDKFLTLRGSQFQVLNHRETVSALELASTQSQEFIKIIGLHTYSQSPDRNYEISEQEEWVSCGGFRFQQFWIRRRS